MDRLASTSVPALPLQLLARKNSSWRDHPLAVVAEETPNAPILWVNEKARASRILPGMRYAAALALVKELRAGVIEPREVQEAVAAMVERLRRLSPGIEPKEDEPGVFWLDAKGLSRLHPSLTRWAGEVKAELSAFGVTSTVVVGFSRFATYALARAGRGIRVLEDPEEERGAVRKVALSRLGLDPKDRDALGRLGVETVGAFLDLPADGIGARFGPEVHRLHRLAAGDRALPVQGRALPERFQARHDFEPGERDVHRLLFAAKRLLDPLLSLAASRGKAVSALTLRLRLDKAGGTPPAGRINREDTLAPAAPSLDSRLLLELLRLRLESLPPQGEVTEMELVVEGIRATAEQLAMFQVRPRRDLAAGGRALARLKAEFGEKAVVHAVLRQGHLPEAEYAWEPLSRVELPHASSADRTTTLIRRVLSRPKALGLRERHEPDGWMPLGPRVGPVVALQGPFVVSGGWWAGEVHREYHFAQTGRGDLLWLFYDRKRRRWFLQGQVE